MTPVITFFTHPKGISIDLSSNPEQESLQFNGYGTAFFVQNNEVTTIHIAPGDPEQIHAMAPEHVEQLKQVAELAATEDGTSFKVPASGNDCPALSNIMHCQNKDFIALFFEIPDPAATGEEELSDEVLFSKLSETITLGILEDSRELYCLLISSPFPGELFPS